MVGAVRGRDLDTERQPPLVEAERDLGHRQAEQHAARANEHATAAAEHAEKAAKLEKGTQTAGKAAAFHDEQAAERERKLD